MDERPAATLNVACSWTAPITTVSQSSSSISSGQSHDELLPVTDSLLSEPGAEAGLTQCEGLSQGYPQSHTSLVTSTCQQLPTQRVTPHPSVYVTSYRRTGCSWQAGYSCVVNGESVGVCVKAAAAKGVVAAAKGVVEGWARLAAAKATAEAEKEEGAGER
jgi:hypothetical protein